MVLPILQARRQQTNYYFFDQFFYLYISSICMLRIAQNDHTPCRHTGYGPVFQTYMFSIVKVYATRTSDPRVHHYRPLCTSVARIFVFGAAPPNFGKLHIFVKQFKQFLNGGGMTPLTPAHSRTPPSCILYKSPAGQYI